MTLSIAEALHQAQEAINGGDYDAAAATCGQLVSQFPAFSAAWRTLGEAYREQGHAAEAQRAYSAALLRNYRNPAVYLGLGLLAEEQGIPEHALAFCQVAWELAPQHGHLREPLIRVALRRFGSDGELQYSHAALAQLHASGQRLRRAVDEYRRALAALPDRIDLQLGLAECLWRLGQDAEASSICRTVLEGHPEAGQALVILADTEHRTGSARKGDDYLRRLRAVDPDGALAASMAAINPRADREWLEVAPQSMPYVSEFLPAAPVERPRIAPAPDFDYQPSRPETPVPALDDLAPMSLEEFGATSDDLLAMPSAPEPASFGESAESVALPEAAGMGDFADLGITEEPFALDAFEPSAAEQDAQALAAAFDLPSAPMPIEPLEASELVEPAMDVASEEVQVEALADPAVEPVTDDPFAPFAFDFDLPAAFGESSAAPFDPFADLVQEAEAAAEATAESVPAEPVADVAPPAAPSAPSAPIEIDPATVDITNLDLPEGVPPTGDLTPSEAAGLGFEDFSAIDEVAALDALHATHTAETVMFEQPQSFESFEPFSAFDSAAEQSDHGVDSFAQTIELSNQPGESFDLASLDEFDMDLEAEVDLTARPDFPTVPLEARMPEDDLHDLTTFASVFDTPVTADEGPDANATQALGAPAAFDSGDVHDLSSLAASLEADVAGALARAGEPVELEPELDDAIPSGTGYTSMLQSLGAEGLAPFDPREQEPAGLDMDMDMELPAGLEPFADADAAIGHDSVLDAGPVTPSQPAARAEQTEQAGDLDLTRITQNWDSIDDEILQALPDTPHHGYTDELRSLSDIGLAPFEVEGEEADVLEGITPFDPFAVDSTQPEQPFNVAQSTPTPDVPQHATNGVMPHAAQTDSGADARPATNDLAPLGEDDLLSGLQPFSFEEFDGTTGAPGGKPGIGGLLPASWESGSSASAIPSDEDLAALLSLGDDLDFEMDLPQVDITGLSTSSLNGTLASEPHVDEVPFSFDPGAAGNVDATADHEDASDPSESDLLRMAPGLTEADLDPEIDATIAITRQLSSHEPVTEAPAEPESAPSTSSFDDVPERLTPGTELFTRARLVKQELVSEGVIEGTRELEGDAEAAAIEDVTDTRRLPETDHDLELAASAGYPDDSDSDYDDIISATGATRDTTTLRAALEVTPDDDELRWWLAEALRERGDMEPAYAEYRWIIRHAPERHDAVLHSLQSCVERDQEPEMAHRLIGDIYRRRGDVARASNHAALALQVRRRATAAVRAR